MYTLQQTFGASVVHCARDQDWGGMGMGMGGETKPSRPFARRHGLGAESGEEETVGSLDRSRRQ